MWETPFTSTRSSARNIRPHSPQREGEKTRESAKKPDIILKMDYKGSVAVNVIKLYVQMLSNCSRRAPDLLVDTLIKKEKKIFFIYEKILKKVIYD
jgi:hypothetical protein